MGRLARGWAGVDEPELTPQKDLWATPYKDLAVAAAEKDDVAEKLDKQRKLSQVCPPPDMGMDLGMRSGPGVWRVNCALGSKGGLRLRIDPELVYCIVRTAGCP